MKVDRGNILPTIAGGGCLKDKPNVRCPFAGKCYVFFIFYSYLFLFHHVYSNEIDPICVNVFHTRVFQ